MASFRFRLAVYGMTVLAVAKVVACAPLTAAEPDTPDAFQRQVMPLFERYCVDCHMNGESEGGIALDRFANQEAAIKDGKIWIRVRDAIAERIMPPADEPQPSIDELGRIVAWIEKDFLAAQCAKGESSAPVVLRRLNRR
ncbi:MAG TPA: c-type cytochrome domain-containing protein, partial [Isosphaeraceae bacterium]|nr:c-type cytochrome domain-containing protein [Isosphaeraceae bacterium]